MQLVLSCFPGIGLLDMAFEEEGFCVVRGPDLLWGGDIKRFHPPAGKFDGVIGGPPCRAFTGMANFAHRWKHPPQDLIPEYARVVGEAVPTWFLMENVPQAPEPDVDGYTVRSVLLDNRLFGAAQRRKRRISFGTPSGMRLDAGLAESVASINGVYERAVTNHNGGRMMAKGGPVDGVTVAQALERQGLPPDFFEFSPFKVSEQRRVIVNGVPLPMGRAVARAVKRALDHARDPAIL